MDNLQQLIDSTLREYIEIERKNSKEAINQITLFVYDIESPNSDLYHLARLLPDKELSSLINYFDGDSVKFPSKEEYKTCLLITIVFYLHEIKDMHWNDIKKLVNLPDDEMSYHFLKRRLNAIKQKINKRVIDDLFNLEEKDIISIIEKERLNDESIIARASKGQ